MTPSYHRQLEKVPPGHSINKDVVENPTSTGAIEGRKQSLTLSWLNGLKSYKRHRPDPNDDDEAEYTTENEEDIEIGDPDTLRTKSTRISKQSKRAKLTPEAM